MLSRFSRSFLFSCILLLLIGSLFFLNPPIRVYMDKDRNEWFNEDGVPEVSKFHQDVKHVAEGSVIMPKLGNATAKAALGRATWKLLHTMTLRFPESPTDDEREALRSYFHLLSRLYPCGECAAEFQQLLKDHPPQTASRKTASLWLCHVHNLVNKRLEKEEFDCNNLDSHYDCGCGDEPGASSMPLPIDDLTGERLIKGG